MTDKPKAGDRKPDEPVRYVTQDIRRRKIRPVHADRKAILAAAEAVFQPKSVQQD